MASTKRRRPAAKFIGPNSETDKSTGEVYGHISTGQVRGDGRNANVTAVPGTAGDPLTRIVRGLEATPEDARDDAVRAFESILQLGSVVRGLGRDAETFRTLLEESGRLLAERQPRGSAQTGDRVDYLVASGAYTQEQIAVAEEAVASGALTEMERESRIRDVTESLSTSEVAARLGIDASRVRHRQAAGLLYSFRLGKNRRYPAWQFIADEAKVMPHVSTLVTFVRDAGLPHGTVGGIMTTPQESLISPSSSASAGPEVRMTPVEWLSEGNDPQEVLDLFESYLAR